MSNEQIIEIFFDMRRKAELSANQHEALAWAVAKLMKQARVHERLEQK